MNIKNMMSMCDHTNEYWQQAWPYDLCSEKMVIGFLLNDLGLFTKLDTILGSRACFKISYINGEILRVMRSLHHDNKECSPELIVENITKYKVKISDLRRMKIKAAQAPLPFVFYCYMVLRYSQLRSLLSLSREIADGAFSQQDPSMLIKRLEKNKVEDSVNWEKITTLYPEEGKNVPVFTFGKYKGRPIIEIMRFSPDYVKWAQSAMGSLKEYIDNSQ